MMKHATCDLTHATRSSYSASRKSLAKFPNKRHTLIRVRTGILSGFPGSSDWSGGLRTSHPTCVFRGSGLHGSPDPLQPGGGPYLHPPMSKINALHPDPQAFSGETPRMIPHPATECKRGIPLIFETGKTNQSGNLPTHSAPAKLSETTLMIF